MDFVGEYLIKFGMFLDFNVIITIIILYEFFDFGKINI